MAAEPAAPVAVTAVVTADANVEQAVLTPLGQLVTVVYWVYKMVASVFVLTVAIGEKMAELVG